MLGTLRLIWWVGSHDGARTCARKSSERRAVIDALPSSFSLPQAWAYSSTHSRSFANAARSIRETCIWLHPITVPTSHWVRPRS